jgi:hypothetical protein
MGTGHVGSRAAQAVAEGLLWHGGLQDQVREGSGSCVDCWPPP